MDIRTFIMIGGVELVAEVTSTTDTGVWVKNPLRVLYNQHQNQMVVDFSLVTLALDEDVGLHIRNTAMLADPFKPTEAIENSYRQQLSGIVVPNTAPQILHS